MKTNKKPWPLTTINGKKSHINTNPDFQRPSVWTTAQKQLLVDTILRDYDVPKLYWRKVGSQPDRYDVVDGQQRLRAIWSFFAGEFKCATDADPIDGLSVAGVKYDELPDDLRSRFDVYSLDIIVLEDTDEDEVREMFVRLQNGTTLKAQEKRNAFPGKMRDFVRSLTAHPLFSRVGFTNSRFAHDQVAAQLVCLELAGEPTNIKNTELNRMYAQHREFDAVGNPAAKRIKKKLDILGRCFSEKTPELKPFNLIALYCVISELQQQFVFSRVEPVLFDWFVQFEQERLEQEKKDEELGDAEWFAYKAKISNATDSGDSIRWRMEFMLKHFLHRHQDLPRIDNVREFTHEQKLVVFRRDQGICQVQLKCAGAKLTWDDWHCDHKTAWSKGGTTTVENGQVSCVPCNLAKSNVVHAV